MDMMDNLEFMEMSTVQLGRNFRLVRRDMTYTDDFLRRTDPKLIIDNCFAEIPPELYEHSGTYILYVDFIKVTCLHNLLVLLKHCSNLRTIKFTTISLDNYKRYSQKSSSASPANTENDEQIQLPHLWSLEFENFGILTKDELIILDFFTTTCNTSALRHLSFITKHPFEFTFVQQQLAVAQTCPEHNEVMTNYGEQLPLTTLARFMIKNHVSLNTLMISRSCFNFFVGNGEADMEIAKEFSKVQLGQISFLTDTFGIEHLLVHQRRTVSLICRGNSANNYVNPAILTSFAIAIKNCTSTLCEIQAQGILLFDGNYEETFSKQDELQETLRHDLSKYQNCNKLKTLNINFGKIMVTSKDKFRETIPGSFINGITLPVSLATLELTVGTNSLEEFQAFTSRFSQLVNLEHLKFTALSPYEIDEQSFRNILSLPSRRLIYAHFINAVLVEEISPQKIILQMEQEQLEHSVQQPLADPFIAPPHLLPLQALDGHWEIKMSKNGVFFGKTHVVPIENYQFQPPPVLFNQRIFPQNPLLDLDL